MLRPRSLAMTSSYKRTYVDGIPYASAYASDLLCTRATVVHENGNDDTTVVSRARETNPADALKIMRKVIADLRDARPAIYWWVGKLYSRVPGSAIASSVLLRGWIFARQKRFKVTRRWGMASGLSAKRFCYSCIPKRIKSFINGGIRGRMKSVR